MSNEQLDKLIRAIDRLDNSTTSKHDTVTIQPDYSEQQDKKQMIQEMRSMFLSMQKLLFELAMDIKEERELRMIERKKEEEHKIEPLNPISN